MRLRFTLQFEILPYKSHETEHECFPLLPLHADLAGLRTSLNPKGGKGSTPQQATEQSSISAQGAANHRGDTVITVIDEASCNVRY